MANGTIAFDTLTTSDSKNTNTEKSIDTSYILNGVAKHWVSFDPLNSNNMDDSFNNASVTDNGTGNFTFTNTNNMGNANHAPVIGSEIQSSYQDSADAILSAGRTTTGMRAYHVENNSATDNGILTMATLGDLA
tara:strand:- start:101 stop:502 length:402 start_codon:yes stop_codon:yes gene_type:complete